MARVTQYPITIGVRVSTHIAARLEEVSKEINIPVAEIVRECVTHDLPKLIKRHKTKHNGTQRRRGR